MAVNAVASAALNLQLLPIAVSHAETRITAKLTRAAQALLLKTAKGNQVLLHLFAGNRIPLTMDGERCGQIRLPAAAAAVRSPVTLDAERPYSN